MNKNRKRVVSFIFPYFIKEGRRQTYGKSGRWQKKTAFAIARRLLNIDI